MMFRAEHQRGKGCYESVKGRAAPDCDNLGQENEQVKGDFKDSQDEVEEVKVRHGVSSFVLSCRMANLFTCQIGQT